MWRIFPPKDLQKNTALKIRMRHFLKKKIKTYSILLISLIIFVVVLYCHLVAINKVP